MKARPMRVLNRFYWTICLSGCLLLSAGCSDSSEPSETATPDTETQAPQVTLTTELPDTDSEIAVPSTETTATTTTPQYIVQSFLTALQLGKDAEISDLLTTRAKQETQKHDLVVRSPGSPNASFEVGGVELVSGGAYVTSLWKEPGQDGLTHQFDIIWILRQQPEGWRIAGMATRVAANEAPTYLNFEEPEEMIRIWQEADRRLATQQNEGDATVGVGP